MVIDNSDGHSNTTCFGGYMNYLHFDPFSVSDSRFIANNEDLDPENNYYNDLSSVASPAMGHWGTCPPPWSLCKL